MIDVQDLVGSALGVMDRCSLGTPGRYRRWGVACAEAGWDALNPYGVADALNLLYTLSAWPVPEDQRRGFIETLGGMQDPATGLFHEATHHAYHTTAHCIAALHLVGSRPSHGLVAMGEDAMPDGVVRRLEGLDWVEGPWGQSHQGAGLYASVKLAMGLDREAERVWEDAYFDWVLAAFDPESGLLRRGCLPGQHAGSAGIHAHMAGTFHYLFCMESARVPLPYPERMIDTCLAMKPGNACPGLGCSVGFITVDWVYCLTRALRQCGHRFDEVRAAVREVVTGLVTYLRGLDHASDVGFNDLHALFGVFCALAEAQAALPGLLRTDRPLRLVLDVRPFI
ncbi:hypothetical protein [Mucisphaera calidilacus]|uniref:Uncharacterized protein n=1 Tax=Mucisphaera calidilacus TaxID=2527982 RepID=A0A518BTP2_9BACT|nr:hypothetical protein [Mucisphaera calidilacus]QDU70334.1 hypothetical protein Pan265_01590 [Mucisphaera calidilacus]